MSQATYEKWDGPIDSIATRTMVNSLIRCIRKNKHMLPRPLFNSAVLNFFEAQ